MDAHAPPLMPMLDRGWHRSPREGACFMELASFLAGERWSDSPTCTHWALAQLARLVNDLSTDSARPQLAPLIPAVIGQADFGDGFAEEIALIAGIQAMPIASEEDQRSMALTMLEIIGEAGEYHYEAQEPWRSRTRAAIAEYPEIERWARHFADRMKPNPTEASAATGLTVVAVMAMAGADDGDDRLEELLRAGIDWAHECSGTVPEEVPALELSDWGKLLPPAESGTPTESGTAGDHDSQRKPSIEDVPYMRTAKEPQISTRE